MKTISKENQKAKCTAIAEHGRISLIIQKGEVGYGEFAKVLNNIEKNSYISWYGDVEDESGKEQSGLVITSKPMSKPNYTKRRRWIRRIFKGIRQH